MPRKANNKNDWQNSIGKKMLIEDLRRGQVPLDGKQGDASAIYKSRLEFGGDNNDEQKKFPARLRNARKGLADNLARAASDSAALDHDRKYYPKNELNSQNRRRWDESHAQILLREDIKQQKHKEMKPKDLFNSREEFGEFSLKSFRDHIYQEVKTQKYIKQRYNDRQQK